MVTGETRYFPCTEYIDYLIKISGCGSRKLESVDSIAYFWMMVDPWIHGTDDPVHTDVDDFICPIATVFADGECGAAESVVSVSEIGTKAKN